MAVPAMITCEWFELHRVDESHVDALLAAAAASHPELGRWLPWGDPLPSREAEVDFLRSAREAFDAEDDYTYFVFEPDTDTSDVPHVQDARCDVGELVGGIGLHPRSPSVAEIGYWVRSDRHRRGYATEATAAVTTVAFTSLPEVDAVRIRMDQANVASTGVPRTLGFHCVGEEHLRPRDTPGQTGEGWIWEVRREAWSRRDAR